MQGSEDIAYRSGRGVLLLAASLLCCIACSQQTDLPIIKKAPEFTGANFDGTSVSDKELQGSIWLASFMFTSCGGPCPTMSKHLAELQQEFSGLDDVKIISFTVDPLNDTEAQLASYASKYGAQPGAWYFLRLPPDEVAALSAKGFLLGNVEDPRMHSTRFALVDRKGNIRGYYDGVDAEAMIELKSVVNSLANEKV